MVYLFLYKGPAVTVTVKHIGPNGKEVWKMTKRITALLLSIIVTAAAFAGCNSDSKKAKKPHEHVNANGKYNILGTMYHRYDCSECGKSVDERHDFKYVGNVNGHQPQCVCGAVRGDFKEHEMRDGKCRRCGWQDDPGHTHQLYLDPYFDFYHYYLCKRCDLRKKEDHELTRGYDERRHYLECFCGHREQDEAHTFDESGKCTVCGYKDNA